MRRLLKTVTGIEPVSQKNRNKMYLDVSFKAYEDTFSNTAPCDLKKKRERP